MALAGCSLGLGGTSYVAVFEPTWVEVNRLSIPIANLPKSMDGFRIVQLSDLHHSRVVSRRYIQYCVKLANQLKPDLILLTGDYVTNSAKFAEPVALEVRHEVIGPEVAIEVVGDVTDRPAYERGSTAIPA